MRLRPAIQLPPWDIVSDLQNKWLCSPSDLLDEEPYTAPAQSLEDTLPFNHPGGEGKPTSRYD